MGREPKALKEKKERPELLILRMEARKSIKQNPEDQNAAWQLFKIDSDMSKREWRKTVWNIPNHGRPMSVEQMKQHLRNKIERNPEDQSAAWQLFSIDSHIPKTKWLKHVWNKPNQGRKPTA